MQIWAFESHLGKVTYQINNGIRNYTDLNDTVSIWQDSLAFFIKVHKSELKRTTQTEQLKRTQLSFSFLRSQGHGWVWRCTQGMKLPWSPSTLSQLSLGVRSGPCFLPLVTWPVFALEWCVFFFSYVFWNTSKLWLVPVTLLPLMLDTERSLWTAGAIRLEHLDSWE